MKLLQFLFPFLFQRNWYTGDLEISRPRTVAFCMAIGFVVVGIIAAAILQMPVEYTNS